MGFYKSFFKKYYEILKSVDKITKTTGNISRNMAVEAFSTYDELQRLKVSVEMNENFQSFYKK